MRLDNYALLISPLSPSRTKSMWVYSCLIVVCIYPKNIILIYALEVQNFYIIVKKDFFHGDKTTEPNIFLNSAT